MKALWLFPLLVVLLSCERSAPTPTSQPTATLTPTPTSQPTATPLPTPTPPLPLGPGMYKVGADIQPGIYVVRSWNCHLERLRTLAGPTYDYYPLASFYSSRLLSSELGSHFYVEVRADDDYFRTECEVTPLAAWPVPDKPYTVLEAGVYLVGRDILPGIYYGYESWNGGDVFTGCPWTRLSGVTGEPSRDYIEGWKERRYRGWGEDERQRVVYVVVQPSDYALRTWCSLTLTGLAHVPTPTPRPTAVPWPTREAIDLSTTDRAPLLVVIRNDHTHGITIEAVTNVSFGLSRLRVVVDHDRGGCSNVIQRFYANVYQLFCFGGISDIRDHETVKHISAFVRKGSTVTEFEFTCEKNRLSSMWKSVFACNWPE